MNSIIGPQTFVNEISVEDGTRTTFRCYPNDGRCVIMPGTTVVFNDAGNLSIGRVTNVKEKPVIVWKRTSGYTTLIRVPSAWGADVMRLDGRIARVKSIHGTIVMQDPSVFDACFTELDNKRLASV